MTDNSISNATLVTLMNKLCIIVLMVGKKIVITVSLESSQ